MHVERIYEANKENFIYVKNAVFISLTNRKLNLNLLNVEKLFI